MPVTYKEFVHIVWGLWSWPAEQLLSLWATMFLLQHAPQGCTQSLTACDQGTNSGLFKRVRKFRQLRARGHCFSLVEIFLEFTIVRTPLSFLSPLWRSHLHGGLNGSLSTPASSPLFITGFPNPSLSHTSLHLPSLHIPLRTQTNKKESWGRLQAV